MMTASESDTAHTENSHESVAPAKTNRARRYILGGFIALVTFAVGFGGGVWLALPKHPGNDSPEAGFARDMSTHHSQAVEMAMLEYKSGDDEQLRTIGYDMALTQFGQISTMNGWLREWKLKLTSDKKPMAWMRGGEDLLLSDGRMPGMASKEDIAKMNQLSGRELDILFCQLMIAHHTGGIHMVDALLAQSDNEEVRKLAETMKAGQQYEIDVLNRKLESFGVDPIETPDMSHTSEH